MSTAAIPQRMSAAEYLEWERGQLEKHEYHCGTVFEMPVRGLRHNLLSGTTCAELAQALRDRGCTVFSSGQHISAEQGQRYVYADVVVVCGRFQTERGTSDVLANPSVVVEILSRHSAVYDRGEKWAAYQRIPSLTDYLLVDEMAVRVEHYQREAGGAWRYRQLQAGDTITLSNGATLAVDAIYDGAFAFPATST